MTIRHLVVPIIFVSVVSLGNHLESDRHLYTIRVHEVTGSPSPINVADFLRPTLKTVYAKDDLVLIVADISRFDGEQILAKIAEHPTYKIRPWDLQHINLIATEQTGLLGLLRRYF